MNKYIKKCGLIIISLLCSLVISTSAKADTINPFTLYYNDSPTMCISINQLYTSSETIYPFTDINSIFGLSISGNIVLHSDTSIVKIILTDTNGLEYLVSETCRLYENSNTVNLSNYCEETFSLPNVTPYSLKICISNASIHLNNIYYVQNIGRNISISSTESLDIRRTMQIQKRVDAINQYNETNNKLWYAIVTPRSLLPYEKKKLLYGISNDSVYTYGIEYYGGGIIEIGEPQPTNNVNTRANTSSYIDYFDWRNRHGKNWLTSVKHQGESGYCVAFAINSALEGVANLYYNSNINLDLSEMDIVYNYSLYNNQSIHSIYNYGMNTSRVVTMVGTQGVIDEYSLPFIDSVVTNIPSRPEGTEHLRFSSYKKIYSPGANQDETKRLLIKYGPMVGGISNVFGGSNGHAMALVGYKKLQAGDSVRTMKSSVDGGLFPMTVIQNGDPRIGKTFWIYKDSYGVDAEGRSDGYMQVIFNDSTKMSMLHYIDSSITTKQYDNSDIQCTDEDGDGFYYWGLGERPEHCPSWAPTQPDGDDSDYSAGPMDEYGYCLSIDPNSTDNFFAPIHIRNNTTWNSYKYYHQHIMVENGASLTITSNTDFYKGATIYLNDGTTLVVDGSTLNNVKIEAVSGSKIVLRNNGTINYCSNEMFSLPLGAELEIINGVINLSR